MEPKIKELATELPRIIRMPARIQLQMLWPPVIDLHANTEKLIALMENRTPPDNTDLRKVLEEVLKAEPPTF